MEVDEQRKAGRQNWWEWEDEDDTTVPEEPSPPRMPDWEPSAPRKAIRPPPIVDNEPEEPSPRMLDWCEKTVTFASNSPSSVLLIKSCRDMSLEEKAQLGYPGPAEFRREIQKAAMEVDEQRKAGRQN